MENRANLHIIARLPPALPKTPVIVWVIAIMFLITVSLVWLRN